MPAWTRGSLLLALTLIAGIAIGIGYERRRAPMHDPSDTHHMLDRLTIQLGLDSAQAAAVVGILARRQGVVDSTWHAMRPHVRATMDSTVREINGVLRPDQAARFREIAGTMHPGVLP